MTSDYAVHSDFLVHWTGKDLDYSLDPYWGQGAKSTTDSILTSRYLRRLYNILEHGLWLTAEPEVTWDIGGVPVTVPSTPKTCFTELKLSESRVHARRYGRLGIGVKRPYLFRRCGRPLAYFGFHTLAQRDEFLKACARDFRNPALLNFFKPMNSSQTLNYDLYAESEWRILLFEELLKDGSLVDPRDPKNGKVHAYFQSLTSAEQNQLKYLAPLDGWLALIIYPSLAVKTEAQRNGAYGISEAIRRIKPESGVSSAFGSARTALGGAP